LGEYDEAFGWLDKSVDERFSWLPYLAFDPRLNPLHRDTRFAGYWSAWVCRPPACHNAKPVLCRQFGPAVAARRFAPKGQE